MPRPVVPVDGLEPSTSRLKAVCSTTKLHRQIRNRNCTGKLFFEFIIFTKMTHNAMMFNIFLF